MPRRLFLLALAAYFAIGAAWAVALPVNGVYDEKGHIVRAYAVASGQWLPTGSVYAPDLGLDVPAFDAPASLLPGDVDCTWHPAPPRPASCQSAAGGSATTKVPSTAARYSPVYYAPVGLPLLIWPDRTGVVVARLVSALLAALLLAAAVVIAARLGNRLLVAALALVATPMTMNLAAAVNPNGLEIAAGILLFTALLALLRGEDPQPRRWLLWLAAGAAVLMITTRQLGALLCAVDVAACLAVAGHGRVRALWRRRDARLILGGAVGAGLAFFAAWVAVSGLATVNPLPDQAKHLSTGALLGQVGTVRVPFYLQQIIGQFSYGETTISRAAIAVWYALWAVVVLPALLRGGWRVRLVLAGLTTFCGALLIGLEVAAAPVVGWSQHGRYVLPTVVGIVLIAAVSASAPRPDPALGPRSDPWQDRRSGWLPIALVAVAAPLHGYALARVMTRFQVGIDAGLDPLHGSWQPPGGPVLPLGLLGVGLALQVGLLLPGVTPRHAPRPSTTVGRSSPLDPKPMAD